MQNNVLNILILSRRLGSSDESATLVEQHERLLLYANKDDVYSNDDETSNDNTNDDQELISRLNKLSLVESLIDFSDRFSADPIDVVILENKTMAYLKAEPDLWLVLTVSNNNNISDANKSDNNTTTNSGNTNGSGLIDLLKLMYRSFITFNGNINKLLGGPQGKGWKTIKKVQELRKLIRKLERDIIQEEQDYESLTRNRDNDNNDEESFGIRQGTINIDDLKESIMTRKTLLETYNNDLKKLLNQEKHSYYYDNINNKNADDQCDYYYTPTYVKRILKQFFLWYIRTGEVAYPSGLQGMTGIHYFPVGHPSFGFLLRMRQGIEETTLGRLRGSLIVNDGQVVWTDIDEDTTFLLYDFVRLQENSHIRKDYAEYLSTSTKGSGMDQDWANTYLNTRGFVTDDWGVCNLEDIVITASTDDNDIGHQAPKFDSATILSDQCISYSRIWCPRIHITNKTKNVTKSDVGLGIGPTKLIGRLLVYRQGRFFILLLLDENDTSKDGVDNYDKNMLKLCTNLQRSIASDLSKLEQSIEFGNINTNTNNNSANPNNKKKNALPNGVRMIYFNAANRAIKAANVFNISLDPLLIWPNSNPKVDEILGLSRMTLSNEKIKVPQSNISYVRPRFPLSSSLLAGCLEDYVLVAINDLRETLSERYNVSHQGVAEACIRVASLKKGGIWAIGRRLGDRYMFLVIEGCATLNEMYDQVNFTTDGILGQIMI